MKDNPPELGSIEEEKNDGFFNDENNSDQTISDCEDQIDKTVAISMKKVASNKGSKGTKSGIKRGHTQDISLVIGEEQVEKLCKRLQKNGEIDYQEFISHLNGANTANTDKVLRATFDKLDTNGDQTVTSEELKELLCQSGTMSEQEQVFFKEIMDQMDSNMDDKITFKEFKTLMQSLLIPVDKN